MTRLIERPLDEPPSHRPRLRRRVLSLGIVLCFDRAVPPIPRWCAICLKVGCASWSAIQSASLPQRPDLFIILMTVITTATPTYGATLHKMYLRIAGAIIGGAVSLLAIIIVTPNFESLPAYMLAAFVVFYPFAYSSLGNARMSFAGKQMGSFFVGIRGLSPSANIYEPLWRIWGVLLGDLSWRSSSLACGRIRR